MVKNIEMTNGKIYDLAGMLLANFDGELVLPVKINFYLQKNMNKIVEMGRDIEKSRIEILNKYGEPDEETQQYNFTQEVADKVTAELSELMALTQEVKIYTVELDAFDSVELTGKQMSAIEYMIEDYEEELEELE